MFFHILPKKIVITRDWIFTSLKNSATPIIERNKSKGIKLKKAIFGLTRSRFEVLFEDYNGKIKKRLIMLPCSMTDGQNETGKEIIE